MCTNCKRNYLKISMLKNKRKFFVQELVLEFHGSNILSGWTTFKDLGVFPNGQVPSWALLSHVRGRNTIKVVGRKTGNGTGTANDDEHDDGGSDVTAL